MTAILCPTRLWHEQFNDMPVRVAKKHLPRAIGPLLPRTKLDSDFSKMRLPGIQFVRAQGEMIAAVARIHRLGPAANEMQFLNRAQPKPGARKGESRAGNRLKPQDVAIKLRTPRHVGHVERNVIQLEDFHRRDNASQQSQIQPRGFSSRALGRIRSRP